MAERIHDGALEHPTDWAQTSHRMLVFLNGIPLDRSDGQSLPVHCYGIVHEQLNPHRCETHRGWASRAMRR